MEKDRLENMVFMLWGGFRLNWYYILFHNKYRKGTDRRTIKLPPAGKLGTVEEIGALCAFLASDYAKFQNSVKLRK